MEPERKLEIYHGLTEEMDGLKKAYNYKQQFQCVEDMIKKAEEIKKAAEEWKPKTEEERKEEIKEEVLGIEEGIMSEMLDEVKEMVGELEEDETEDLKAMEETVKAEQIKEEGYISILIF